MDFLLDMKKIFQEFKDFALQGTAADMFVGIIIGSAFSNIIDSFVQDIIMPPIWLLIGGIDFSGLSWTLNTISQEESPQVKLNYGTFINTVINFTILAFAMFFVIKAINTVKRKKKKSLSLKHCPECQMQIPVKAKRCGHCAISLG